MTGTLFLILGLAAFSRGAVVPAVPVAPLAKLEDFDAVPQYSFAYDVQDALTGDSKAQYETRNGDIVQGSYSLIEADGTRRIVEYTADPINGFNAIVSREPVNAAVAVAAPLQPFRPAALTPVALPVAPAAAPAPSIPAIGPDSDVEVVEARSGPLTAAKPTTREQEIQRQQLQQLQRLQDQQRQQQDQQRQQQDQQRQQQEQQLRQLQQLQEQQKQSSRLQIQQQQQLLVRQRQGQAQEQQQQEQQQQEQQQAATPARVITGQLQQNPIPSARLVGLPTAARAIATYPTYPYAAYSTAYSSPFAYAAPLTSLAYAPAATLA